MTTPIKIVLTCVFSVLINGNLHAEDPNGGRNFVKERADAENARKKLSEKWQKYTDADPEVAPPTESLKSSAKFSEGLKITDLKKLEEDAGLSEPERASLAIQTVNGYVEPEEIRSRDGVLTAQLVVTYARNFIGNDPVYLRSYNGGLVGPTLRAKPGDVLRITLKNTLPTQPWQKDSTNTLHDFNTTNLHFHGLHVSPNGLSDNVLIAVGPGATQEYVVEIPEDHACGTFWYHPHRHGSTAANVASGMSGALIIEGDMDEVPEIKAAKERVFVLNQIPYIYKNEIDGTTFDLPEGIIEEHLIHYIFGPPTDWPKLGRHTTINGVELPVIRMRPGQVERWRIVASGQRESLSLQVTGLDGTSSGIPFHEIAVDGLPLGKSIRKDVIELFPGYRSDVLVQAPAQPGEFLLVDQAEPSGFSGHGESLKHIARIVVAGEPEPGKLPSDDQLTKFRLPSLKDAKIDGTQTTEYGLLPITGGMIYAVDGKSFDMNNVKELLLGNTDEWTVTVRNGTGINTGHPFHIHVNPFEVQSIMGPKDPKDPQSPQVEHLTDGPVWRDTIWVPNNGTVKFRTRYEDFIGTFVQHCHILDHEDQGMMQLVDIRDPKAPVAKLATPKGLPNGSAAPAFDLPSGDGSRYSSQSFSGRPYVVFLFKGHGCLHCSQQVGEFTALYERFQKRGIRVVGISTDNADALKSALESTPCPFPILADPKGVAFAAFGCSRNNDLVHGTFFIDEKGKVSWSSIGSSPYMNIPRLLTKMSQISSIVDTSK